jgi:hypothetical protein
LKTTAGLDWRYFGLALVLWRGLVNEMRRYRLFEVLVVLFIRGFRPLLVIGVMSGKIDGILICDPELLITLGKLLTRE